MPTIFDLLDRLAFLRGMPAVVLLLLAAFVAVTAWDYRLTVPAVLAHYLLAGLLFVDVLELRLAFVYTLNGVFVSAILLITAGQVNWGRPPGEWVVPDAQTGVGQQRAFGRLPAMRRRRLLRLIPALVVLLVSLALILQPQWRPAMIPAERAYLFPAIAGLWGLGLVGLLTRFTEPLPFGVGLLLGLTGFALYDAFLRQSTVMTVALLVAQLFVTVAVAYLAQARYLAADDLS